MLKFNDLTPQPQLRKRLDSAYDRVMSSGTYVRGNEVVAFEKEWADYNEAKYCISCGSGLDALQLVLRAWGISHSAIKVPGWTASSTWSAVEAVGAMPIPTELSALDNIPEIVVHLYGHRAPVMRNLDQEKDYILQDCAQCHGLKVKGTCAWSFYPTKNLGAYGDAGAITTDDTELAAHLVALRNHGTNGAINSRMDPLQAAFLRVKLPYLNSWNQQRKEFAQLYTDRLQNVAGIELPTGGPDSVWHQYTIILKSEYTRDSLKRWLVGQGIETMVHYPIPPHRALGYQYHLPEVDWLSKTILSLPIAPHLRQVDIHKVCDLIEQALG